MDVQKDPAAVRIVALEMAPLLAEEMAVHLASTMLKAARAAYSTTTAAALPRQVEASMNQIQATLVAYAKKAPNDIQLINAMAQNVNNIRKYSPGLLYSPPDSPRRAVHALHLRRYQHIHPSAWGRCDAVRQAREFGPAPLRQV